MPMPGDVHVNQPLTNISVAFIQDDNNFVAGKVFPVVPVVKQSDRYYTYAMEDFFRDEAEERAPGTESAGADYGVDSTPTYFCPEIALHKDVSDTERANTDNPLKPDEDATIFVTQKLLIRRERIWVNSYFKTGIWDTELAGQSANPGANQFLQLDQAESNPIKLIKDYKIRVSELTGFKPNTLTLGAYVYSALCEHPAVLDRIKYTQKGIVTTEILASLLDIERVFVPFGVVNTAAKGKAANNSFIFGKHMLLTYSAPNPGLRTPSAGYTFAWTGKYGNGAFGNRIKQFRIEKLESDRVEGQMSFDCKKVSGALGVFFKDAVS